AGEPESLIAFQFTPNVFSVLGASPILGRFFSQGETHVTVLSYALWERHFGGRRDLLGQSITLNKESYTVVGVMPKDFDFPSKVDLWTPLTLDAGMLADDKIHIFHGVARLKDGVTIAYAQAVLSAIHLSTNGNQARGAVVQSVREASVGDRGVALLILQAAVSLLMLVAIANTAGILLARAKVREREVAIRI